VDSAHSKIAFSGRAPEGPFEGSFAKWSADIRFSPEALARSKASVTIQVNSVNLPDPTGVAALKGADWFDVAAHPTATFVTTAMRRLSGDKYEADGMLTIRGKAQAVKLPFTLSIAGDVATMSGALSVDRAAFGVGEKYGDDTVSKAIKIAIAVRATR
jgi:polyisoprenoid-binding protein YceI